MKIREYQTEVSMTQNELRLRQLTNQYLLTKADKRTVLRDLNGVQAQFMTNALHAMTIRCSDYTPETAADGLVKNWTIRGTVHVFHESDLSLYKHCNNGADYRKNEWHGYHNRFTGEVMLSPERQAYLSEVILDSLKNGSRTRDELKQICRDNGMTPPEEECMFDQWGGGIRDLCERGFMNYVVQEKKAYTLSPPFDPIPESEAMLEIARRYFTNLAPATIHDAMYYFHTTKEQVKIWLNQLPVTSAECEGMTYYWIGNGKSYDTPIPDCIFLAGFDQLLLAYQKTESLYLPQEHLRKIFNLAGIVNPAVLLHGRIAGRWQKKGNRLNLMMFESVSPEDRRIIEREAERLWNSLRKIEWM